MSSIDQNRATNAVVDDSRSTGEQAWECGHIVGYSLHAIHCCGSDFERARYCRIISALFQLGAVPIQNPASTSFASTSTSRLSSSSSILSKLRPNLTSRLSLLSHSTLSVTSPATTSIKPHIAPSTQSLTPSPTSSLVTTMLSCSLGKTSLASVVGVVLGGIAVLGMTIGGLWIGTKIRRTKTRNRGTECPKHGLSKTNGGLFSPFRRDRIHEIHSSGKGPPELPAPGRYELTGDDGACEMPTLD